MPGQIIDLLCVAIEQDMAESLLASLCHNGKEIVGNAQVRFARVFVTA